MPLSALLYTLFLMAASFGSIVYNPFLGVLGYIATYHINPVGKWWGAHVGYQFGIRYSMLLALAIAIGIVLHRSKLRFRRLLESQEKLLVLFLGLLLISTLIGHAGETTGENTWKLVKVFSVLLMVSHVLTDLKRYETVVWTFIATGTYMGYLAYNAPDWMFTNARLNTGLGGADFAEANFLAAHFGMLVPFTGIMFINSKWKGKIVCVISSVLVVNGLILIRSRGAFLALILSIFAGLVFSKGIDKWKLLGCIIAGVIGFFLLTDTGFWTRMGGIETEAAQMDRSSSGRIELWKIAAMMTADHPLGVGEGNFKYVVAQYRSGAAGLDTHNTFLRCSSELGMQGLLVFLMLILNAFRTLSSVQKKAEFLAKKREIGLHIFAVRIALVIYLASGLFISLTYIEELYWLLMFPVFLKRSVENESQEL